MRSYLEEGIAAAVKKPEIMAVGIRRTEHAIQIAHKSIARGTAY
jgi:hypothetical protein